MDSAGFNQASFEGDTWFDASSFEGDATFERTSFATVTTLDAVHFGRRFSFARTDLRLLTFRRCQMGNVALAEAYNVAEARFDNCE